MQNECYACNVACVNTDVADAEVLNAFAVYVLVAGLVLTAFGFLRRHVPIYEGRSYLRSLRASGCAPPREPERRTVLGTVYGWIPHALKVSDAELVDTAGLDALVFLRIAQFGTQLFIPLALAGMFGLVPIHLSQSFYETTVITKKEDENPLVESKEGHTLMKMTIANIKPRSRLMWTHVCGFWIITAYTLWLLHRHYRSYEFLRQVYGTTTGESNPWRAVHIPQTIIQKFLQQGIDTSREFATGEEGVETRNVQSMRRHSVAVGRRERACQRHREGTAWSHPFLVLIRFCIGTLYIKNSPHRMKVRVRGHLRWKDLRVSTTSPGRYCLRCY